MPRNIYDDGQLYDEDGINNPNDGTDINLGGGYTGPVQPRYNPPGLEVFVTSNIEGVSIQSGFSDEGEVPTNFNVPFPLLLKPMGVRITASRNGYESDGYYILKGSWERRTETYDRITQVEDEILNPLNQLGEVDDFGTDGNVITATYNRPQFSIQKYDLDGNRILDERVNTHTQSQVDLFFEMTQVIVPAPPRPIDLLVKSYPSNEELDGTDDDLRNLAVVDLLDENVEVSVTETDSGFFLDEFPDETQEVLIRVPDERYTVTSFELYDNSGGEDEEDEVGELYDTITDTQELRLTVDDSILVIVRYELAVIPEVPKPEVRVIENSITYNVDDDELLSIEVELLRGDGVRAEIAGETFEIEIDEETRRGRLQLESTFFTAVGQYIVDYTPFDEDGEGIRTQSVVNVTQDPVTRVAQFTEISYPTNIGGADYEGYNTDFEISWETEQCQRVDVAIGDNHENYGSFNPNSSITLNVNNLINSYGLNPRNGEDSFTFVVKLSPFLNGEVGIEEVLEITFNKSKVQLPEDLVEDNLEDLFFDQLDLDILDINSSKYLTHIANIEGVDYKLISNWDRDDVTFTETELDDLGNEIPVDGIVNSSLVLKLFEPLPTSVQPNTQLWISKIKATPFIDRVTLDSESADTCIKLRPPNFESPTKGALGYEMFDEIVGSDSTTSSQVIDAFVNQHGIDTSKLDIEYTKIVLNPDYDETVDDIDDKYIHVYDFHNFVHFGSAEEQSINFLYKVSLLSEYDDQIEKLETSPDSGSISVQNDLRRIKERKNNLKGGFNGFEKYLYLSSEPLTYPKDGNGDPLPTNNPQVDTWFDTLSEQAIEFDKENKNSLVNNMPSHITQSDSNDEFIVFLHMIGQHYDILWSYINGIKSKNRVEQQRNSGVIDDLVYHMLESFGWDVDSSVASQQLWQSAFGLSDDGTVSLNESGSDYQTQIWRRLLNNLPYLLKHKGTKRTLSAIISSYGIPQSSLTIMEFGGPKREGGDFIKYTYDDLTSALKFTGGESIEVQWGDYIPEGGSTGSIPNSVEFRVNPTQIGDYTLIDNTGNWNLQLDSTGSVTFELQTDSGLKQLSTSSSTIYNSEYSSILVNRELVMVSGSLEEHYNLHIRESQDGIDRITTTSDSPTLITSESYWESGSVLSLFDGFNGLVDEFRLWTEPLDISRFENHTLSPDSIDGNTIFSSTEDLLLRFDFEKPKNRGVDTGIRNVAPNEDYGYISGSAIGFVSSSAYPYSHEVYERRVTANVPSVGFQYSNKVRIDDIELISDLSPDARATKQNSKRNPIDSNRLGAFFSPIKEINMDIVHTFGDFRIDDYIGDPTDRYKDDYTKLKGLRHYYFNRLNLNIYEYIQLVRYIDKSLFNMLENGVPARAKFAKGLLIEPHLLERPKVKWERPEAQDLQELAEIDTTEDLIQLAFDLTFDVDVDVNDETELNVDNFSYDAEINEADETVVDAQQLDLFGDVNIEDLELHDGEYLVWVGHINADINNADVSATNLIDHITIAGGGGEENPTNGGFGLFTKNGYTEQVTWGVQGLKREKVYVELIKECREIFAGLDATGSVVLREVCETKLNIQPADGATPTPGATVVDGYLPSHYKFTGDRPKGLELSYFRGSKNTSETTLDGSPAVESFVTNPNTLRVNDAGRGSGEPILITD